MILKSVGSKLFVVNLLSDFILSKIPSQEESVIQVIDCSNFFIIKGRTTHNDPLDLMKIKDEFIEKFEDNLEGLRLFHTIDLIEYNSSLKKKDNLTFTYHNTNNCSYNKEQIEGYISNSKLSYDFNYHLKNISNDDNLISISEFPHGYSLNQKRLLYYYGKHITYNITFPFETLTLSLSNNKIEDEQELSVICDNEESEILKSAILDFFDFDMSWLEMEIKKVDWYSEITNPLEDYEFLKVKLKDFVII